MGTSMQVCFEPLSGLQQHFERLQHASWVAATAPAKAAKGFALTIRELLCDRSVVTVKPEP